MGCSGSKDVIPIDIDSLVKEVGDDREFANSLLVDFKNDVPEHLDLLRKSIKNRDFKNMKLSSHSIKGTGLTLKCIYVVEPARKIEMITNELLKDNTENEKLVPKHMKDLEREYLYLVKYLDKYLQGL